MKEPKKITMLELRKNARMIVREVSAGETYLLSYRGEPVMELKPVGEKKGKCETRYDKRPPKDDPIYRVAELATEMGSSGKARRKRPPKDDPFYRLADLAEPGMGSLTNEEIDKIVYGI